MQIEYWSIDKPKPYLRNARKIPEKAIAKVAKSLAEFGWKQPLVVDSEGVIVVGHTRLLAAKRLGWNEVPVVVASDLTSAQVKAYRLMDNRSHDETDWDLDILNLELNDLSLESIDLALTGFELPEIERALLNGLDDAAADACPEVPEKPVTRLGDVWVLGKHRLACGDATSAENVATLLDGAKPLLMVTDPPYGVEYDPAWRNEAAEKGHIAYAARSVGKVENDGRVDWADAYRLFPGSVVYVWHASMYAVDSGMSIVDSGFEIRATIVWGKPGFQISRGHYHWQHEPCWYAVRKGGKANWCGDRSQSTLWSVPTLDGQSRTGHGTQKPVELMERSIRNHKGDVYDPFCGSGSTLIAADQQGRRCWAMEIDPAYCDVIVDRWERHTGQKASRP